MRRIAHDWGAEVVLTGAETLEVRELLGHYGATPYPGDQFVLPVERP
jgi:hypothetical protein